MKLSILMPCLNESETIGSCIRDAQRWIKHAGKIEAEILIADNGSTDGSQQIAIESGARVINVEQRGYGAALYYGSMQAQGMYIIMGDSDSSYDFSRLDAFLEKLDQGYDLVMGNRFQGGIESGAMPWKNRYIGNPILTWIGKLLFKCPINDFHCGLRGFSKEAFLRMDLRTTGMEFASEMVIKATLLGMKVTEVPTTLFKDGRSRPPHLRPWRDGWRHLRFMLLFSPRWLFFVPGITVFILSVFFYIALLFGTLNIGGVFFDVHTLFYAQTGITIGYLSSILGVIVKLFGMREGILQRHSTLDSLRNSPILEIGGAINIAFIVAGIYLGFNLLLDWGAKGFGQLGYGAFLRSVSISTLLISCGGIGFLSSLIMGFLALPIRRNVITEAS
jgi:glycosyltransferase involved in cell wall biosynthesis